MHFYELQYNVQTYGKVSLYAVIFLGCWHSSTEVFGLNFLPLLHYGPTRGMNLSVTCAWNTVVFKILLGRLWLLLDFNQGCFVLHNYTGFNLIAVFVKILTCLTFLSTGTAGKWFPASTNATSTRECRLWCCSWRIHLCPSCSIAQYRSALKPL